MKQNFNKTTKIKQNYSKAINNKAKLQQIKTIIKQKTIK